MFSKTCEQEEQNKVIEIKILKRFLVIQNFSKALRIGFISFNLSSLDKGC